MQAEQLARIPARIAVLPCRLWPEGSRFAGQKELKLSAEAISKLCQQLDPFILRGFEGQPYMRGLSPRVLQKLLDQNTQSQYLAGLDELWFRPGIACSHCKHPASYYREVIAPRQEWRTWLVKLAKYTSQSDAILLPLIVGAGQGEINDRGLAFGYRQAEIALLLIDTNNGELIWIGGRDAEIRLPKLESQDLVLPSEEDLWSRLLVPDIWMEFPGRQLN